MPRLLDDSTVDDADDIDPVESLPAAGSALPPAASDAVIDPRHPYVVAQAFAFGFEQVGQRLVHHHGRWLSYCGTHYREVDTAELRARAYRWLSMRRRNDGSLVAVSQTLVNSVLDGLRSAVHEGGDHLPRWTGSDPHPHPANLIAFNNGLLDVERWLADPSVALLPHDPAWLSTNVLPFDYTPQATCPQWETFVAEVAAGDDTWVAGLAMMFGYLLTHDSAQQKIFLFQGAPRAGKGTICRVLREMLGHANVAGPSLPSLCGEFGLWPLVGKSVAIIPDAHAGRGSDATRVLEVLKSISGEDAVDVNRKHRDQQTMRLPVRFLIACNSMLDLPDPSGALAGRLILFPFTRSFQGNEDHGLEARLLAELPGILRWSLAGLRALRTGGRLLQPDSGEQVRADFARLSSPIRGFIDERLVIDPAGVVPVSAAFQEWKPWCEQEGHKPGSTSTFGAKLLAALPGITKVRTGSRDARQWSYRGIRLRRSGETLGHAWTRGTP